MSTFGKRICFLAIMLLLLGAGLWLVWLGRAPLPWENAKSENRNPNPGAWLQAREDDANKTVWKKEILAQTCGRIFESFWDSVNATTNKLGIIATFDSNEFVLGRWDSARSLPHGIEVRQSVGTGPTLTPAQWQHFVEDLAREGWGLDNLEFRHIRFDTDQTGQPSQSRFYFAARLTNPRRPERALVEGDLAVNWTAAQSGKLPAIKRIDASQLTLSSLRGESPFKLILNGKIVPPGTSPYIDPLILHDLDGDGLSEIIWPRKTWFICVAAKLNTKRDPYVVTRLTKSRLQLLPIWIRMACRISFVPIPGAYSSSKEVIKALLMTRPGWYGRQAHRCATPWH